MKKVVICSNVNQESFNCFSKIEEHVDLSQASVHLINCWAVESEPLEGQRVAAYYPNEEQTKEISKKKKEELEKQKGKFKNLKPENFHVDILTNSSPKRAAVEFLKENDADLVICLTPSKDKIRDFFHSSFTNFLAAHAPCDLLMIRQK